MFMRWKHELIELVLMCSSDPMRLLLFFCWPGRAVGGYADARCVGKVQLEGSGNNNPRSRLTCKTGSGCPTTRESG